MSTLYLLTLWIKVRPAVGDAFGLLFIALLYPLIVPTASIYCSAKLLLLGEDRDAERRLALMKGIKMFEQLGQYFLTSRLKIKVLHFIN